MKKCLIFAASMVIAFGLYGGSAWAQTKARVEIPFKFFSGTAELSAGRYEISAENARGQLVIRNMESGAAIQTQILTRLSQSAANQQTRLTFEQVGEVHYLVEVHFSNADAYELKGSPLTHAHKVFLNAAIK